MMKSFMLTIWICISALVLLPTIAHANAKFRIMQGTGDYANKGQKVACPARTCSMAGTSYAHDVRNCSAAHCRK